MATRVSKGAQYWHAKQVKKETRTILPIASNILSPPLQVASKDLDKQALKELIDSQCNPPIKEYLSEILHRGYGFRQARGDGHCAFHSAADWILSLPREHVISVFSKIRDDLAKEKRLESLFSDKNLNSLFDSAKSAIESNVDTPDLIHFLQLAVIHDALKQDDASRGIDTGFDPLPIEGDKEAYMRDMSAQNVTKVEEEGGQQELALLAQRFGKNLQLINQEACALPLGAAPQSLQRALTLLKEKHYRDAAASLGAAGRELRKNYAPFSRTAEKLEKTPGNKLAEESVEELLAQGNEEAAKKALLDAHLQILKSIKTTDYKSLVLPPPDTSLSFEATLALFATLIHIVEKAQRKHTIPEASPQDLVVIFRGGGHYDRLVPPPAS